MLELKEEGILDLHSSSWPETQLYIHAIVRWLLLTRLLTRSQYQFMVCLLLAALPQDSANAGLKLLC